jgi:integrase
LFAVNEEGYVQELSARTPGSPLEPRAIAPPPPEHDIVSVTPKRRRKGPSMSRRRGQTGYVWQKNQSGNNKWDSAAPAYGQVWIDAPGRERRRKFYLLGVCRTKSEAKRRLKEMIERDRINSTVEITQSIDSITFDQQSEWWIKAIEDGRVLHRRKRTRIKPATIDGYKCAVNWLSPHIGKTLLANIKNAAAKELVANMKQAGLSNKTIVSYFQVLQSVIASVVNGEGEQVHPRTWDSHFIGLPVVNPKKQNRPTRTAKEIEMIIAASWNRYQVLYSLLAGSGLRIGEALALKIDQHISDKCSTIHVRQSLWHGTEQEPKTQAAVRDVDVTKELAALLAKFIGDRKDGYLFCTDSGKPLSPRNILRDSLHPTLAKLKQSKTGFHCFRRFRESVLQKSEARALLVDYWMGHENREMGTRYAKQLVEDVAWRKQWAKKVGLGFKLTDLQREIGQLGQLSASKIQPAKAA